LETISYRIHLDYLPYREWRTHNPRKSKLASRKWRRPELPSLESRPGLPVVVTPAPGLDREVSPPQGGRIDALNRGPLRRGWERKRMTINGSLYRCTPMLKQFSAAKKLSPVKIVPHNGGFRKYKGLNIKYSHRDPKKHFLTRNDVLWHFA